MLLPSQLLTFAYLDTHTLVLPSIMDCLIPLLNGLSLFNYVIWLHLSHKCHHWFFTTGSGRKSSINRVVRSRPLSASPSAAHHLAIYGDGAESQLEEMDGVMGSDSGGPTTGNPHWSRRRRRWHKWNRRYRRWIRRIVKSQGFYWVVIILVFLNTGVLTSEHYRQPLWLDKFQSEFSKNET